jgi:hypothetical protein
LRRNGVIVAIRGERDIAGHNLGGETVSPADDSLACGRAVARARFEAFALSEKVKI